MATGGEQRTNGVGKDLAIYVCILALAALQFAIAYQHIDATQMFVRMLIVALVEAGLALLFFMHLWTEKRALMWLTGVLTVFVLLAMQYGWTDSYRILNGVPWAK